jgi:hypothetical protein
MTHGWRTDWTSLFVVAKGYSQGDHCLQGIQRYTGFFFWREVIVLENNEFWKYIFTLCCSLYAPMHILQLADQKIPAMDKLHYYVCQMDKLLAKYVKIAEVGSGHILELDKSMENMRFMINMKDQYMRESDNKEDGKDDVEDIDPGDKLVNYFNNGNNYYNDDDDDDEEEDDDDDNDRDLGNDDNVHGIVNKGGRQLVASCLSGRNYCR